MVPSARFGRRDAWSDWRRRLIAASTFGQLPLIRRSLGRCTAASRSFGLKARLSRLLTHEGAMRGLRELLARKRVRLIRLERRNRIKQALAEYRRLHAGLGHFTSRSTSAGSRQVDVDLRLFRKSVAAVERSHRLASKVLTYLQPAQPLLTLSYESLLTEHDASVRRVEDFLALASPAAAAANPHAAAANAEAERVSPDDGAAPVEGAPQAYHKATPDRLCAAVRNYAALCREWWHGQYAEFFDEPCEAACGPGRLHYDAAQCSVARRTWGTDLTKRTGSRSLATPWRSSSREQRPRYDASLQGPVLVRSSSLLGAALARRAHVYTPMDGPRAL